jgi:hypothetical protein
MSELFKPIECGPARGTPPTLEWVAIDRLNIDAAYQRATDGSKSRRIIVGMVRQWDWALCQPLVVSRRADGSLFVLDGQHRLSGARERGDLPHLPCVILHDRDAEGEAEAFVALNTRRQRLSQSDVFNGMLAAGDDTAASVAAMLRETGWRTVNSQNMAAWKPGDINCAAMLARMVRTHGEAPVRNALTALREAYQDTPVTVPATLLKALVAIYAEDRLAGADVDVFIESLATIEPRDWIEAGRDMRRCAPSLSPRAALAEAMLDNFREHALDKAA